MRAGPKYKTGQRAEYFGSILVRLPQIKFVSTTDECINWPGLRNARGYGYFHVNGRYTSAHRLMWQKAAGGPIPPSGIIMHTCDNPPCVNPRHLRLGTALDNVTDCNSKGRRHWARGVGCHNKLSEKEVIVIRKFYAQGGMSQKALGTRFGVAASTVGCIIRRRSWKHILEPQTTGS